MALTQEEQLRSIKNQIKNLTNARDGYGGPKQGMRPLERDSAMYKRLVKSYNDITAKITALETQVKPLQIAANKIQADKTAAKNKQKTDKDRIAKQEELARAIDRNDTAAITQINLDLKNLDNPTPTTSDPNIVGPDITRADDPFGNAARERGLAIFYDKATGETYLKSSEATADPKYQGNNEEHYIWFSGKPEFKSKLPGFTSTPNMRIDYSYKDIETKIIEDAKQNPDGLKGLFNRLYIAGEISKSTRDNLRFDTSEFSNGLNNLLRNYSKRVLSDYEIKGIKEPISFNDYLDKQYQPDGPKVDYDYKTTLRHTADSDLNRFFMENLGSGATDEQRSEYYKELRALERKSFLTKTLEKNDTGGTTGNTAGEFIDGTDILELQRKIAGKALDGSDVDVIVKGGAGAGQLINGVLAYAKKYGVSISNKDAMGYVAGELKLGQADMKKVNAKLLAISKATYSNLSDVLSEDVSLNELSYNYKRSMQEILEVDGNQVDVMDKSIQTALKNNGNKGAMNLTEFERLLKQDARWGKTTNARETASNYANSILKNFGLIA